MVLVYYDILIQYCSNITSVYLGGGALMTPRIGGGRIGVSNKILSLNVKFWAKNQNKIMKLVSKITIA